MVGPGEMKSISSVMCYNGVDMVGIGTGDLTRLSERSSRSGIERIGCEIIQSSWSFAPGSQITGLALTTGAFNGKAENTVEVVLKLVVVVICDIPSFSVDLPNVIAAGSLNFSA